MQPSPFYLQIAIDTPLRRVFDYVPCPGWAQEHWRVGVRVRVPFRNKDVVGLVMGVTAHTDVPASRLKQVLVRLDDEPVWPVDILRLLTWAAEYYHHPVGEVAVGLLPVLLRQGESAQPRPVMYWKIVEKQIDESVLKRSKRQLALLHYLQAHTQGLDNATLKAAGFGSELVRALKERGIIECIALIPQKSNLDQSLNTPHLNLNSSQQQAVTAILAARAQFKPFLLEGVTGSGKTEVYLQVIAEIIQQGQQALVLVPEISLTPQLLARFTERFHVPMAVLHSKLNDRERLDAWIAAKTGAATIVIGTRSAAVTPMPNLGIIIIDEEHDISFKQQEGFRYSARDVALMRAHRASIPIVLGTATPSLETFYNVQQKRYQHLHLPLRAGSAMPPTLKLIDIRKQQLEEGLSSELLSRIDEHLKQGNQVLIFINRRGFAPTLMCHQCGWIANCKRCDAHMTMHYEPYHLHCHHCDATQAVHRHCVECKGSEIMPMGLGTERIEQVLQRRFPERGIVRIDRDTTQRKHALNDLLAEINQGRCQILIGTQMLAKGHHFPDVTLVGILDADAGLFSADFRSSERMGQLLIQVAGRAGRAEKPGEVVIQTHLPQHPLLTCLLKDGYNGYAHAILTERQQAQWPPITYMALLRAEATNRQEPHNFLRSVRQIAEQCAIPGVNILGPIPALLERKAGRYRAQLLLRTEKRQKLHELLKQLLPSIEQHPLNRKIRWSLDVDPQDLY